MILDIIRKEIKEISSTKRLLIIGILFVATAIGFAVYYGHFLKQGPNEMVSSGLYSIILMFVSLLALILAYDTIVGERSRGSLSLVLSKPVGRVQIFVGKFLAIFLFIAVIFLIVTSLGYWLNAAISQEFPSGSQIAAAYKLFFVVLLLIACWISFAMLFSTCFKSSAASLVTTLVLWRLVLPLISQMPIIYYVMRQGDNHGSLDLEGVELPGWGKVLYAFNPDLCIAELSGHFLGTFSTFGEAILSTAQSIVAMVIFLGLFFIIALLLFRRLSLE